MDRDMALDGNDEKLATRYTRRELGRWLMAGSLLCAAPPLLAQQVAGGKPSIDHLNILIPANTGGGWDATGRTLGMALEACGAVRQVSFENMGGDGGIPGLEYFVKKYSNDPYALMIGGSVMEGAIALKKPAVTLKQVAPLARLTSDFETVVVKADSPIRNAKDLIAQLRAKPRETVFTGGSAGGVDHVYAGMLARVADRIADFSYLPFPGTAEAVKAVLSGQAMVGVKGYSAFIDEVKKGTLRFIGISSRESLFGIPSMTEQGVNADAANWHGVFMGLGTSAQQQKDVLDAVRRAVASDAWRKVAQANRWVDFWMDGPDLKGFVDLDSSVANVMVWLLKLK
jgi:putative tricarboxylic transport membrane protein